MGDPEKPELHTVTTVDYFFEVVELLTFPHRPMQTMQMPYGIQAVGISHVKEKESPAILKIRSTHELMRDQIRAESEAKIRQDHIAENEEIDRVV